MNPSDPTHYARKVKLLLDVLRDPSSGRAPRGFFQRLLKETDGGVTRDYLYQVAAGRIKEPSIEKLELLSSALGIPMDWWRLPVEAGPPRIGENGERTRSILAQLLALPPEQREEAFRQIEDVLGKLGEEAEGQQPMHGE